jgi:hypothetical protein
VRHRAVESFWDCYQTLPVNIRKLADKNYEFLQTDPSHPSLRFKEVREGVWSVRVGLHFRALAYPDGEGFTWFWIGSHAEYDRLIK